MCLGPESQPQRAAATMDPAQEVLNRETTRQNNVTLGKANIDKAFSQFNDDYYTSYADAYKSNYIPQIDDQYKIAVGKTLAALAGRGMDRSSVGAARQGKLAEDYVNAKTTIASEADTATQQLRSNVENAKGNLYALNSASADPAAANAQALGQAKTLVAPPQYSPLGEVFASALQPFNNAISAQNNTPSRAPYQSPFSANRRGSATVVK